jgi:hypothetical protein
LKEGLLGVKSLQGNISLAGAGSRKTAEFATLEPLLMGKSRGVGPDFQAAAVILNAAMRSRF